MLSQWPFRYKLIVCLTMLCMIVAAMSFSGFQGVYSYRRLARSVSERASELPIAESLVDEMVGLDGKYKLLVKSILHDTPVPPGITKEFLNQLQSVQLAAIAYQNQLNTANQDDDMLGDTSEELAMVNEIRSLLTKVDHQLRDVNSDAAMDRIELLTPPLNRALSLARQMPRKLQQRMNTFADKARLSYRTWIVLTWIGSIFGAVLLIQLIRLVQSWLVRPFGKLISGSRRVASGDLEYQITVDTNDEVAELAAAMNNMTRKFKLIRDDLDQQVKERTREVIRSEQLASVGFLAAGVAHEINNPLATIAMCAESLESRVEEVMSNETEQVTEQITVIRKYLQRIQNEAFRCKGITEQLLDFSRLGNAERQHVPLVGLVTDVVEMVQHLGKYKECELELEWPGPVFAIVNPQEFKQVALNLVTNALDSLDDGGRVKVSLTQQENHAQLEVVDDGCGMSERTLEQIFEPFFTDRQDGSGTGLGLSITHRIVDDHGGKIHVHSDGTGKGATFIVTLPSNKQLTSNGKNDEQHPSTRVA